MSAVCVELVSVCKAYSNQSAMALNNINLKIATGEFLAIMGPSGCGKSTLLNLIAGIDTPSSGAIILNGKDLSKLTDEEKTLIRAQHIGFIFQFFNLLPTLTVSENVSLVLELSKKNKEESARMVNQMLERVGMKDKSSRYPHQLSGGEMQRTAIARALINVPPIILADEPTGNLDSENGKIIMKMLQSANKEFNMTILLATHSEEAASYCKKRLLIKDGLMLNN